MHNLYIKKPYYPGIFKELAREIGSKAVYVRRLIYAYELFKKIESKNFYGIEDLDEENFDISLITDAAVMHNNIADYMGFDFDNDNPIAHVNDENLKDVTTWLYKKEDGVAKVPGRQIRVLNKVLGFTKARRVFLEEGKSLEEAAQHTDLMDESIRSYLNKSYSLLLEAQKIVHLSENPSKEDIALVDDILASAELISAQLRKAIRTKQSQQI